MIKAILKLCIGLLILFNVYIWNSIYNALNESYIVCIEFTV